MDNADAEDGHDTLKILEPNHKAMAALKIYQLLKLNRGSVQVPIHPSYTPLWIELGSITNQSKEMRNFATRSLDYDKAQGPSWDVSWLVIDFTAEMASYHRAYGNIRGLIGDLSP